MDFFGAERLVIPLTIKALKYFIIVLLSSNLHYILLFFPVLLVYIVRALADLYTFTIMFRIIPVILKRDLYVTIIPSKLSVLFNSVVGIKVNLDIRILSKVHSSLDNVLLNLTNSLDYSL